MKLHVVERQVDGSEGSPTLPDQLQELDGQINVTAERLVGGGDFTWNGRPLSGPGEAEVVSEGRSIAISYGYDNLAREWLLLYRTSDAYETYRILRTNEEDDPVVQELEDPQAATDPDAKYERDQLLDVLHGCQRDRIGSETLPDF